MLHRVALFLASLTAALVLAGGLALGGLAPAADPAPLVADATSAPTEAAPAPTVKVDTVYVTPKRKPKHITITRTVAPRRSGDGEHEHEGGGD